MKFDAILCDIDGCLAAEAGGAFDLAALAELADYNRRAQRDGGAPIITVCTGRPQPFAEAMCRLLANDTLPCVCEMGVWLYHPGTNHYELDPTITQTELDIVANLRRELHALLGPRGVSQQPGKVASVALYHPEVAVLRDAQPEIEALIARHNWPLRVSMTWSYTNCDLLHISKASGIRRWLTQTGFDPARCAGIGDTTSDQPLRDLLGWFGCPANAHPKMQAQADFVAGLPEAPGVVQIVGQLVSASAAG